MDLSIEIGFEELEKRFDSLNALAKESGQVKPSVSVPGINSDASSEIMTRSKAMQMSTMGVHLNDLSESIFKNDNDDEAAKSRRVPGVCMSKSLMGKLEENEHPTEDLMTKSLFVPKSSFFEESFKSKEGLEDEPKLIENPSADYVKPSSTYRKTIIVLVSLIFLNLAILGVFYNMKSQHIKLFQGARDHLNDLFVNFKSETPESLEAIVDSNEAQLNKSSMLDELMFKQTQSGSAVPESATEGSSFFEQLSEIAGDIIKKAKEINITLHSREEPKASEVAPSESSLIWLNIGGRRFNITQGILFNNDASFVEFVRLAKRFEDEYWFARDGDLFEPLYSYIVLGKLADVPRNPELINQIAAEAKYYRLNSLSEQLNAPQNGEGVPKKRVGLVKRLLNKLVNIF